MITAAVLAGGKSKRMGRDKLFIEVEGRRLLQRVLDILELIFDDIMIVVSATETGETLEKFNWVRHRIVQDLIPDKAAMGGLYTGLYYAASDRLFAVGGDMPFLSKNLIKYIVSRDDYDIVIPRTSKGLHPLHAVYSKNCLPVARAMIEEGDLSISSLVRKMGRYEVSEKEILQVDPDLISLINVNTSEDLEIIKGLHIRAGSVEKRYDLS